MEPFQASTHSFRLLCPDAQPQQMHLLRECGRVSKYTVVISLGIELSVSQHEHPASSTETSNVGEEIKMIERNPERLHSSHGKAGHRAVIAIGECPEGRINVRNEDLSHIVFEGCRHLLHCVQHFGRSKWFSG